MKSLLGVLLLFAVICFTAGMGTGYLKGKQVADRYYNAPVDAAEASGFIPGQWHSIMYGFKLEGDDCWPTQTGGGYVLIESDYFQGGEPGCQITAIGSRNAFPEENP